MSNPAPSNDDLNSWKEIAWYLGISVREAQNREKEGLPVFRLPGKKSRVWAVKSEIDEWKQSLAIRSTAAERAAPPQHAPIQPANAAARPRGIIVPSLLAIVVATGLAIFLWPHTASGPARAEVAGNTLTAYDELGNSLWHHTFLQPLMVRGTHRNDGHPGRTVQVADLDGSGTRQVLFAASFTRPDGPPEVPDREELYYFSSTGNILWQYTPDIAVTLGATRYSGPWNIMDLLVVPGNPTPRIWLALLQWNSLPGVVVSLTSKAVPEVKFVNAGNFYALSSVTATSGRYIVAGGVNNEYNAAALAVIRENAPPSCSPQTGGTRFQCADIPTVNPARYFVFPPTEVSVADGQPYNAVQTIQSASGDSVINIQEANRTAIGRSVYTLTPLLELRDVIVDDGWAVAHRRAEADGMLHHSLAECPVILAPMPVRRWNSASGWTTVEVPFQPGTQADSATRHSR